MPSQACPPRQCRTLRGGNGGGNERRDRRPPETVLQLTAQDCRRGLGYVLCIPDSLRRERRALLPKRRRPSLLRAIFSRASLVVERGVWGGCKFDAAAVGAAPLRASPLGRSTAELATIYQAPTTSDQTMTNFILKSRRKHLVSLLKMKDYGKRSITIMPRF